MKTQIKHELRLYIEKSCQNRNFGKNIFKYIFLKPTDIFQ